MITQKNLSVKMLLIIFLTVIIAGCTSMLSRYDNVKEIDTIEAYEEFIQKYPDSEFTIEASKRIEELEFDKAKSKNTIETYNKFIEKYPDSKFVLEAKDNVIAMKDFENIKTKNTIEAFNKFIKEHPNCSLVDKAKEEIKTIICKNIKTIKIINNTSSELDELFYNPKEDIAQNLRNEGFKLVSENSQAYDAIMTIDYKEQIKYKKALEITRRDAGVVDEYGMCYVEIICNIKVDHNELGEIATIEINGKTESSQLEERRNIGEKSTLSDKAKKVKWDKPLTKAMTLFKTSLNDTQYKDLIRGN